MPPEEKPPSPEPCTRCGCPLGAEHGEVAFRVRDGDLVESWCPQDFIFARAPRDPGRFPLALPGQKGLRAARCTNPRCALVVVDVGVGSCAHCGCRSMDTLGPKQRPKSA